ncbi:hypothetical protein ATKI12_7426 [Kitasatospora sp. Ki12]
MADFLRKARQASQFGHLSAHHRITRTIRPTITNHPCARSRPDRLPAHIKQPSP